MDASSIACSVSFGSLTDILRLHCDSTIIMSSILSYKACSILETKSSLYALPWNLFIEKENQEGEEEEEN